MDTRLAPDDVADGRFDWDEWEALIEAHGITIDRPRGSAHPRWPEIIYPIDYGYVNDTISSDDHGVDVFVGSADNGLVGLLITTDFRKGDREVKLLYDCTADEIYLVNGFLNFDRKLMEGTLTLRRPLHLLR
ncbi:MAG: hypothetical protein PVJ49_18035 [Acidobacteriota bacterium]|jgi:inorganic pyrophosphatase